MAAAWWSDRSGRWTRVPDDPAVFGHARMDHVWKRPDGYTALGHLLDDLEHPEAPMVWRSADGRRWRRCPPTGPTPLQAWATVESPQGIVALTDRQAWWSPDGVTWERTAVLGDPNVALNGGGRLFRAGGATLAVFDRFTPANHGVEVHWSDDGRHWHPLGDAFGTPIPDVTYISSVRTLRGAIVAVGTYDGEATIWESHDDGRRWRRTALTEPAFRDADVADIAEFDGRLVLVGGIALPGGNKPRAQPIAWLRPTDR